MTRAQSQQRAVANGGLTELQQCLLSNIHEEEIVAQCSDIINIPSPTGHELGVAEFMRTHMQHLGLEITWQPLEEGRANAIGRLAGQGNGKCLMFNGHMDTSNTGDEKFLTGIGYKPHAAVKNGLIYRRGSYNMT